MVAALVLVAAQFAPPAPLPDRWLLKLVPEKLPELPAAFFDTHWYYTTPPIHFGRQVTPGTENWERFRRGSNTRLPAAVTVSSERLWCVPYVPHVMPLAVHGPLVEYSSSLHTAAVYRRRVLGMAIPTLELGAMVETDGNVWYHAESYHRDGVNYVSEWRLDFKENPRTADKGSVTVRHHLRRLEKYDGESWTCQARFECLDGGVLNRYAHFKPSDDTPEAKLPRLLAIRKDAPHGIYGGRWWGHHVRGPTPYPPPDTTPPHYPLVQPPKKP